MTHDEMIAKQAEILFKAFPELKLGTLQGLNADGILWEHVETGKVYYVNKGKAECLSK